MSRAGRIEVICGPMFAGKTEELLRRVRRALIADRHVVVIGHALDARRGTDRLASHVGIEHPSVTAGSAAELEGQVPGGTEIVVTELAGRGMTVIVAGLSVTFDGGPFEPMPSLMALAERVDKLTAICTVCGEEAVFHVRVTSPHALAGDLVAEHVGGTELYEARCRRHRSLT